MCVCVSLNVGFGNFFLFFFFSKSGNSCISMNVLSGEETTLFSMLNTQVYFSVF